MKGILGVLILALTIGSTAEARKRSKRSPASLEESSVSTKVRKKKSKRPFLSRVNGHFGYYIESLDGSDATTPTTGNSFTVGGLADLGKWKLVGETGLLYKKSKWITDNVYDANGEPTSLAQGTSVNILQIPASVKYYFLGNPYKTAAYAKGGVLMDYVISATMDFDDPEVPKHFPEYKSGDLGFAAQLAIGGKIAIARNMGLVVEAAYQKGLTGVGGKELTPSSIGGTFGLSFGL